MARPSSQHPSYRAPCAAQGPKLQEPEAPTVTRTTGCSLHSFIFAAASLQTSPCDSTTSCAHRPQQRTGVTGPPDLHPLPSRIRQCSGKCRRSPSHPGYHTTMCSTEHRQHWAGPSPAQPPTIPAGLSTHPRLQHPRKLRGTQQGSHRHPLCGQSCRTAAGSPASAPAPPWACTAPRARDSASSSRRWGQAAVGHRRARACGSPMNLTAASCRGSWGLRR